MILEPTASTVVVLAKRPVPGRVKTRLTPPLSPAAAAALAAAALRDTLGTVDAAPVAGRMLAFDDDDASGWLPAGWDAWRQPNGGLDVRIGSALAAVAGRPAVLIGMDTPQLGATDLTAFDPKRYDACLGPAVDGGYWAIGFRDPSLAPLAVSGVPMSTPHTGVEQLARLHALGLRVQLLDELVDVDTIDSAVAVASAAPHTQFARTLTGLPDALPVLRRAVA